MPQYLVAVYNTPETRSRPKAEMAQIFADVGAVNEKAMADGIFVFAGGLHEQSASTTIHLIDGKPELSDGPYAETKEYMGGFWIIDVPDLDRALEWARVAAVACRESLEVRPFMTVPPEGI